MSGRGARSGPSWSRRRRTVLFGVGVLIVAAAFVLLLIGMRSPVIAGPPVAAAQDGRPIAGESYLWRPVAIGGGGFVTGLAADDRGRTLVARSDVYGAYRWDAHADRWRQLVTAQSMPPVDVAQNAMADGVYEIAVAPGDPQRLYMAIKGGLFRSTDGGAHWQRGALAGVERLAMDANSKFRFHGSYIAVSPGNPDVALFGSARDGAWRTTDGGRNWTRIAELPANPPGTAGALFWFERGRQGRTFALVQGRGMFAAGPGGTGFHPLPGAGPRLLKQGGFAPDGSFFGVDEQTESVWRYRGGGWRNLAGTGGMPARAYGVIAIDPRSGAVLIADSGGRVARSDDGGDRWAKVSRDVVVGEREPPWLRVANGGYVATAAILPDPVVVDRFWIASGVGPMVTEAAPGAWSMRWTTQVRGIEEPVANDVIQPPGGSPLFAAWDFGIHVKDDLNAFSTTYGPRERVLIAAQQIDWTPADPRFIVTNASDTRTNCCSEDGDAVLAGYSTDGGRSWQKFPTLPQPPGTRADDPWRMAMGMIAVSADSTDNIVWMPTYYRSAFYTLDRGRSWHRVVLPGETSPLSGTHGDWWMPRKVLAADRVRAGTFYLFHSGNGPDPGLKGLWRTSDGGRQWRRVFVGEIAPGHGAAAKLRVVPGHAGHLFFTSGNDGAADTQLRRSRDGGSTWQRVPQVDHVDDVAFGKAARGSNYPTLFVSGRVGGAYGIWRSIDDAATWQLVGRFPVGTLDQVSVVGADPDVFGRVYLGFKGSGWAYGEPAHCGQPTLAIDRECRRVE